LDTFLAALRGEAQTTSAELRPPRANTPGLQSMDDWIDLYHSVRRLTMAGTRIFITDSAVGQHEEENLRHLDINLGPDAPRARIVPFLTCKHPMDYCLRYAERAYEQGFRTLVVLGGDRFDGIPRCVEHAYELRREIRKRVPAMELGGWANPNSDPARQVEYLVRDAEATDFFLTQVVSHHSADDVARFLDELQKKQVHIPAVFGIFYYRSARGSTLESLQRYFHVPAADLTRELQEEGVHPDRVCARSLVRLRALGVRHLYISNLPSAGAAVRLSAINRLAGSAGSPGTVPLSD
jgi:5,10-methylenetetrahydrofolate reductase